MNLGAYVRYFEWHLSTKINADGNFWEIMKFFVTAQNILFCSEMNNHFRTSQQVATAL